MTKRIILLTLFLFTALTTVFAQTKPVIEMACGCEIRFGTVAKCGKCGATFHSPSRTMKSLPGYVYSFDYICECGHQHLDVRTDHDYLPVHHCSESACLFKNYRVENGNVTVSFKNICERKKVFVLTIHFEGKPIRSNPLYPDMIWTPDQVFPNTDDIYVEMQEIKPRQSR